MFQSKHGCENIFSSTVSVPVAACGTGPKSHNGVTELEFGLKYPT